MFKQGEKVFVVLGTCVTTAEIISRLYWDDDCYAWLVICEGIEMELREKNLLAATSKNAKRIKRYLFNKIKKHTQELTELQETLRVFINV